MTSFTSASPGRIRVATMGAALLVTLTVGCTGGDTYKEFRNALDSNASCNELFDQRSNFDSARDLKRIDADLERIGCKNRNSERTDG